MDNRRSRVFSIMSIIVVLGSLIVYSLICSNVEVKKYQGRSVSSYWTITEYEHTQEKNSNYPVGVADIIKFPLNKAVLGDDSLVFYSNHQDVEVYIEGKLVYSAEANTKKSLGKTPGNIWNEIPIYSSDAGDMVKIRLTPAYESHIGQVPEIMVGNISRIYYHYISGQIVPFVCAVVATVYGIVFVVMTIVQYRKYKRRNELLFMGIQSIVIGMWKLADLSIMHIYSGDPIEISYRALVMIMFLPIPFALYEREILRLPETKYLLYAVMVNEIAIVASWILHITQIAELRMTLWIHHVMIVVVLSLSGFLTICDIKRNGWTKKRRLTAIGFLICVVGIACDMGAFYTMSTKMSNSFGMAGFLIYIAIMGIFSMDEAREWYELGLQAEGYRDMALHDQMTGLYNRHAFAQHTMKKRFNAKRYTVFVLDLNDLKKCNDIYGHDAGDRYIIQGAQIIKRNFERIGEVYRMGGDEFCVLAKNLSHTEAERVELELQKRTEVWNQSSDEEFEMHIACGHEEYKEERDFNIEDTLRHADHRMYENKFEMKKVQNETTRLSYGQL